jgi:tetratricopeptide (TPR) repeat protein
MELEDRINALRRVLQERLEMAIERARTQTPAPKAIDRQREALRLNAAGTRLRRAGAYGDAAEQHRQALTLFHDLGDQHSEALTLNNLALALDHAGDETALQLFEEAATTLGLLGDEQHEGQVIANLALAFRRRGDTERSENALDTALGKLRPESDAYRKVQSLRRAS